MRPAILAILVLVVTSGQVQAGAAGPDTELSTARQQQILRDALNAYDEAVACTRDDAKRAEELFRSAAAGFEALIASGRHNSALEYNLGNTQFRLGRLGRAILHYRRAAQLDPGNTKLQTNLAYARRQVEPFIEAGGQRRLIRQVLFWHYDTALTQRFWAALGLSLLGWLLLLVRLRWDYRGLFIGGALVVILGLAAGMSVFVQISHERQQPPGVIIGQEVVLRLGQGEAYEPALRQPLGAGVELRVLQQRGDWLEVELPNQQTGWLPAASVETI